MFAAMLAVPLERLLWIAGDHRTAALVGTTARRQLAFADLADIFPSVVEPDMLDVDALAEIDP